MFNSRVWWAKGYIYVILLLALYSPLFFLFNRVGINDTMKEVQYFSYIKTSLVQFHSLPYFLWKVPDLFLGYPALQTRNFIANPETTLFSPLTPLLAFLRWPVFIKLFLLVHLLIGVAGSFFLKKRLRWNDTQFRIFFISFFFSALILKKFSIV